MLLIEDCTDMEIFNNTGYGLFFTVKFVVFGVFR